MDYKLPILHPISKNLEVDEFWLFLSYLEKRAVKKFSNSGVLPYEELLCESECMSKMVEWIKKDKYVPQNEDKHNFLQLRKYLIKITHGTMLNAVSIKNFQSVQDEQNKYIPVDDDEEDEQELEDLPVIDINDKIRELRDSSRKKVGMKWELYEIMLKLGTERKVIVPELVRRFPNTEKRIISVTVSHVLKALGIQRPVRQGMSIENIAKKNWRADITYREFCRLLVTYTTSGHTVRHYYQVTKRWYLENEKSQAD